MYSEVLAYEILNMLKGFDIASLSESDRYHLLAESMKLAFADRAHFLGDPDFVPVPKGLIDQAYADTLAKKINFKVAAKSLELRFNDCINSACLPLISKSMCCLTSFIAFLR